MKTVTNSKTEIIIKKSRFISLLYKVDSLECVNKVLENVKKEYHDFNHCCYAYIIDNYSKYNDDKEPTGTAGLPILNVLKKENLNHVICIVIRYFGGIKLGSGGLIRAYSSACKEVLNNSKYIELINGLEITISFNYEKTKDIEYLLKKSIIVNKDFNEKVILTFQIDKELYNSIYNNLKEISEIVNIKDILIEKNQ